MFTSLRTVATPLNHALFPEFQPLNSDAEGASPCQRPIWVNDKEGKSTWLRTAMKSATCGHKEEMATFYCPQHQNDFLVNLRTNQESANKKGYDLSGMTVEEELAANKHQAAARKVLIGLGVFAGVGAVAGIAAGAAAAAAPRCTDEESQKLILKAQNCENLKSIKLQDSQRVNTAWDISEPTRNKVISSACSETIVPSNLSTLKGTTRHTLTIKTSCSEKQYNTTTPFQYGETNGPVTLDLDCNQGKFTLSQSSPSCEVPSNSQSDCKGADAMPGNSYTVVLNTENCVDLKGVTITSGSDTLWEVDKQSHPTKAMQNKCNLEIESTNKQHLSKNSFKPNAFTLKKGGSGDVDLIEPSPDTISFTHDKTRGYIKLDVDCTAKTFTLSQDGTCEVPSDSQAKCDTDLVCTADSSYTVVLDAQNCNDLQAVSINGANGLDSVWATRKSNTGKVPNKCNSAVKQAHKVNLNGKTKFQVSAVNKKSDGTTDEIKPTGDGTIPFTHDPTKKVIKFSVDCDTKEFTLTQSDSCEVPTNPTENCPNN